MNQRKNIYFYDNLVDIYGKKAFLLDHHPNEEGYDLIVKDLYSYLIRNGLISCRL